MKKIFILLYLISNALYAGNGDGSRTVGNGGDVVKCPLQESTFSYQVLDWYEGSKLRGLNLDLGEAHLSIEEKLQIALKRLFRLSPERAKKYEAQLKTFFHETKWLTSGVLIDIRDSDHIALPHPDCKVLQIANQSTPVLTTDKRYIIDKNLWDNLDNDNKAALLLHEVVYREGIELGHNNSISSRFLNSLILSTDIETFTVFEFSEILNKLGFKYNSIQGITINLDGAEFYDNGMLKEAEVKAGAILKLDESDIALKDKVLFHEDGSLKEFTPLSGQVFWYKGRAYDIYPFPVGLYPNGQLKNLLLNKATRINFEGHDLEVKGSVKFFENGFLKSAIVEKGSVNIPTLNPSRLKIVDAIEFFEDGKIAKAKSETPFSISYFKDKNIWQKAFQLHQEGTPLSAYLVEALEVKIQGKKVKLNPFQTISFWERTGKLKSVQIPNEMHLLNKNNDLIRVEANSVIKLSQDEKLIR